MNLLESIEKDETICKKCQQYLLLEGSIFQTWDDLFDTKFIYFKAKYSNGFGVFYNTPPLIDTNPEMGIESMRLLERFLDCELEFKGTFWLECVRTFINRDFMIKTELSTSIIFESFLNHMIHFNDTFPSILPIISWQTHELHKAANFHMKYDDRNQDLIIRILQTEFIVGANEMEKEMENEEKEEKDTQWSDVEI